MVINVRLFFFFFFYFSQEQMEKVGLIGTKWILENFLGRILKHFNKKKMLIKYSDIFFLHFLLLDVILHI